MVVSYEHGPAPVWILLAQQESLSTLSCVGGFRSDCKERIACRLQCWLCGRHKRRPPSTRELPTNKFGG
jgi:hypothetical protein